MTAIMSPAEARLRMVREASIDDVPAINELFYTVFGLRRDDAATQWKFFRNPNGPASLMVAEDHGRIVGSYALWPIAIHLGREVVLGAQSIDTMTHPDYRRQGVLVQLALAGMEVAAANGVEVLYGFPNEASYPASVRRLNWNHIGNCVSWTRPLRADSLLRIPRVMRPAVSLALRAWPRADTNSFDVRVGKPRRETIAALLEYRGGNGRTCQTERSPEWYDWRFAPLMGSKHTWLTLESHGRPVAFAVWGREPGGKTALLSDVVGENESAIAAAIAFVLDHARAAGCSALSTLTNRQDLLLALRANGFRFTGEMPFKVRSLTSRPFRTSIDKFENWRLLGADCDVY
jgi:GNAT superfamily N-acetyltransferase